MADDPEDFLATLEQLREFAVNLDRMKQQFVELGWAPANAERIVITFYEAMNK